MAVAYYGSHISEHLVKTPEGYLICYAVPINRTGTQLYTAGELGLNGDPERSVTVYRLEEDVFAPAALASLEGKDVTRGHPPEMLNAGNQAGYSKGHLENVRRDGENTVADLVIKDPSLVSDVETSVLREVSCGYNCQFEPYQDGYRQTHIVGNHVAIVPRGRAGRDVAIKDAAEQAEKGRKQMETMAAPGRLYGAKLAWGALVLAALLLVRWALFMGVGILWQFPGEVPWGRFGLFTLISWAVSMMVYALQQGLSLRFANQAVALVCGISGSFLGILSLLFPPALTRCIPWGYYGLLSLVGMNWDPDTRFTWFYWEWPVPTDLVLLCLWAALFLLVGRALFVRKEV